MWAPYDSQTYALVLDQIAADDIVLEIGAGDLRLSRRMAAKARRVYAVEINPSLCSRGGSELLPNLQLTIGDARTVLFPQDITLAVLLMRHCTHFAHYFDKLRAVGCRKLVTNARWGMNVETIDLGIMRPAFQSVEMGWYACRCGRRGFKAGPPEAVTGATVEQTWEVDACPACLPTHLMGSAHV